VLKRAPLPQGKQNGAKNKGFTISSPGSDEDEWVSSESGAATPSNDLDDDNDEEMSRTPVEHAKLNKASRNFRKMSEEHPRAETPIPRVNTARPNQPTQGPPALDAVPAPLTTLQHSPHPPMETRSETDVPSSYHMRHTPYKRHSRPPSTHSVASRHDAPLRPHPLIRGHSFGAGINLASKPVPLAPLEDTSESSPGITASPPHSSAVAVGNLSSSPTSIKTASGSPSSPSHIRPGSFSSARSATALPAPQMNQQPSRALQDRTRTLSALSSSSSSSVAALSSLVHLPTQTRPSTPHKVSYFPPTNPNVNVESIHPLLPPPYLSTHLTVLTNRTPLRESYDRVIRAKQGR
jgi:hypothetical protein